MAQLSRLTDYIDQQAKAQADAIIEKANQDYSGEMERVKQQAQQECDRILEQARVQAEGIIRVAQSAVMQKNAQNILSVKIDAIEQTIQKAQQRIAQMEDEQYSILLETLLDRYAESSEQGEGFFTKLIKKLDPESNGVILFNEKDKTRISDHLKSKIASYHLTISENSAPIGGGFVLQYGNIEENCSIEALIRDKREKLTDEISRKLF